MIIFLSRLRKYFGMDLAELRQTCKSIQDWWGISETELDRLSLSLLGARAKGKWLRHGQERAIIAKLKYGAVAQTIPDELAKLSRDVRMILAEKKQHSALLAAAYYHVRFENIHPLHDGNGRVGRTIITGQLYQAYGYPPVVFEQHMKAQFAEYRAAFKAPDSHRAYQKLLVLLSGFVRGGTGLRRRFASHDPAQCQARLQPDPGVVPARRIVVVPPL
jgi:hypothetical protein